MRVSLGKTYKINMGNYEHVELQIHVTLDDTDLYDDDELADLRGIPDEKFALLRATAMRYLEQHLEPELKEAAEMSQATASMLIDPAPAPRRTERTTRRRSTR